MLGGDGGARGGVHLKQHDLLGHAPLRPRAAVPSYVAGKAVLLADAAAARLPSLLLALVLNPAPCSIPCCGPGGAPMAAKVNRARRSFF